MIKNLADAFYHNCEDQPQKEIQSLKRTGCGDECIDWIKGVNGVIETYPNIDYVYVDTCASTDLFMSSLSLFLVY